MNKQSILKVALAVGRARLAGTERHVLELAAAFDKSRVEVTVLVFSEGPLVDELEKEGIRVQVFGRLARFDPLLLVRMVSFFRRESFDVVHGHPERIACLAAKLARVPAVLMTHHLVGPESSGKTRPSAALVLAERLRATSVDFTVAVSRADAAFLVEGFHRDPRRVRFIANGIRVRSVGAKDRAGVLGGIGIDPDVPVACTAARLTEQKGLRFLIRAMKNVVESLPQAMLVVAGEGELEAQLKNLARDLGLGGSVLFTGYRDDVLELVSASDVFVLPSLWEGMPYALLEAMLVARPVVTTSVCAEVVSDGETGYVVPPQDEEALARAITKLLSDRAAASAMGLRGRKRLEADFSAERMAAETLRVYNEILTMRTKQDFRR